MVVPNENDGNIVTDWQNLIGKGFWKWSKWNKHRM